MFELVSIPVAVVGCIVEFPICPALVTLRHGVTDDSIGPPTSVQFYPHADGALVVAVREEADLARPDRSVQLLLGFEVGVDVAVYHLEQKFTLSYNTIWKDNIKVLVDFQNSDIK